MYNTKQTLNNLIHQPISGANYANQLFVLH